MSPTFKVSKAEESEGPGLKFEGCFFWSLLRLPISDSHLSPPQETPIAFFCDWVLSASRRGGRILEPLFPEHQISDAARWPILTVP